MSVISDADFAAWLRDSKARRVWLVELPHPGGTEYVQRGNYSWPGSTVWRSCIDQIRWSDRVDGNTPVDSIRLINAGDLDNWLSRDWLGQPVRLLIGDITWPPEAFRCRAVLRNGGIKSASDQTLEFAIHNPLVALDVNVQPVDAGRSVPVCFGKPFNVSPPLINRTLGYQAHSKAIAITAVRDKGGTVASFTAGSPVGGFTLNQQFVGGVTCDPAGPHGTAAELVQALCAGTGITPSAQSMVALPTWPLGIYCNGGETRRAVLDQLLSALLASPVINAAGELELRFQQPPGDQAEHDLTGQIRSLAITAVDSTRGRITVNYARNWTVQDANALLADGPGITPALRQRYGQQWLSVSQVLSDNSLADDVEIDTPFTAESAARSVLASVAALRSQTRYRARVSVAPVIAQSLWPGDTVRITWPRYGLESGRNARVLGVDLTGDIEVYW